MVLKEIRHYQLKKFIKISNLQFKHTPMVTQIFQNLANKIKPIDSEIKYSSSYKKILISKTHDQLLGNF